MQNTHTWLYSSMAGGSSTSLWVPRCQLIYRSHHPSPINQPNLVESCGGQSACLLFSVSSEQSSETRALPTEAFFWFLWVTGDRR